jgi:dipeptidase E
LRRPERRILALGGGGFTCGSTDAALDDLVLELAGGRDPRICFLPTASGDPDEQIARFYARFGDRPCEPSHLSLFRLPDNPVPLAEFLAGQDVVYVGGGSMRNMLAVWRVHNLDAILAACWRRGIVLAGLSAGAMCWFAAGVTRSTGRPEPVSGLRLLPGSLSVHRDTQPERLAVYRAAVARGVLPGGWALDDGVGLVFAEREVERVVSSRPDRVAVRVERSGEEVVEPELLCAPEPPVPADISEWRAEASARSAARRAPGRGRRADGAGRRAR